ncbi:MAG: VOC family protein [Spirosomataceae bacterium]
MKIEHIALWTNQLEELKAFYTRYFQAKANQRYHNPTKEFYSYFLSFDSGARLEIMSKPQVEESFKSGLQVGLTHLAFSVGSVQAVDEMTMRLRENGIRIIGEPRWTGDGYYESVIADPDGNLIEITI